MNEEALQKLYTLAKGEGYGKSYEDFKVLMSQNEKAVGDMFSLARAEGYEKNRSDFDVLVGYSPSAASEQEVITEEGVVETDQSMRPDLKKKDVSESVSADGLSEQQGTTDFLDYSQMVSSPIMQDAATRPLVAEEDVPTTIEELTQTLSTAQRQGGQRFFEIDGEYVDLLHPDGDKRRENLDRYQAFLNQQEQQEAQRLKEEAEAMTPKIIGYDKFTGNPIYESKGMPLIKFDAKEEKEKREAQKRKISKIKRFTEGDKEKYDSYNPLVNASATPLKASQQKGYLPGNVEFIPKAADIVKLGLKPVVPFDMEAYNRDKQLYAMMYDAEVETYKDYLKDKAGYVRAADGRYYNPENFNAGEIFNNKINKLVNQELIEKEEEAVSMMLSDELSPFGFKVDKTGTFTDRIIVTAPNGERQEFSLNNFFDDTDFNESVRLKAFLKRQYAKELTGGNIPRDIYGKELSLLDIDVSPQQNADIIDKLTSSERRALDLDRERVVAGQGQLIYESDKEINNLNAQLKDTNKKIAEAEKLPESYKEWRGNVEVTVKNQERADRLQFLNKKKSALEKKINDASFENRRLKKDKPINPVYKEFFSDNLDAQIQTDTEVLNEENRRHIYLVDLFKEKENAFLEAEKQALALAEQSFDKKTQTWKSEEAERDYNKLTNVLENEKILLNKYGEKLLNEDIRLKIKNEQLTRDVGRKAAIQAEIGELGDSIVSAIVSGTGSLIEGGTEEFAGNIIRNINNMFYDETDEEYITDEEMNDLKKQSSIKKDWVDSYGSWADLTPEAMQAFRESLGVASIGFYGALESSPAMLLSLIPGGRALAPLGFSFLSAQNLREQMDNNPDFDYMSENDKLKFIAPMAFTIGLLENYGVRNVMRNSSFLGKTAAKLAGKGPTSKTLNEISDDLGKNYFQREFRKYVTTGLGELETEAMQEALDIYGKEYMDLKMKNNFWDQDVRFFKDEKGDVNYFSKAALSQIIESGMAGFFGGLTMKAPSTIVNAIKGNKVEEIDDFTFMFYEAGMESPTIANAQRAQINNDIASGKLTKEQGDEMWNTYTRTVGQMREVKKVAGQYDTNTKKKLLSLLMEKKQLEEKIDGVDKSLTREEQRKIKVAEERIQETLASGETKLTEDKAAYEQAKKDGYKGTFEQHRNGVKIKEVAEQAVEQEVKKKKPVKKAPIKEEKPVEAPAVEETTEEAPVTEEERAKMREVLGEPVAQEQVVEETPVVEKAPVKKTPAKKVSLIENKKRSQEKQGNVYTIQENGKDVGEVMFTQNSKGEIVVQDVEVSPAFQKKGIATKAYQAVNEMVGDKKVVSSTMFVEEGGVKPGEKLWESLVKNKLAKKTKTGFEMLKEAPPVVEKAPVKKEAPKRKRRKKKVTPVVEEAPKRNAKVFDYDNLSEQPLSVLEEKLEEAEIDTQEKDQRRRDRAKSKVRALKAEIKIAKEQLAKEKAPVKKAPKKTTKKKAPVKEEPQVSEEVQKEIDRAERLRDRIVADKTNKISRTKGFEQKEEIRDEIRQTEKKYNNIITELKEGKRTRFRLSDDAKVEAEEGFITEDAIVEVMKGLGSAEMEFKIPVGEKQIEVDPIALSKSLKKITDAQAKKLGFKSVADMLKNIEEFNGIPMVIAMSDVLAAGTVKDSMGNDMEVGGGLLYNVLGPNKTLAWAGVNKDGANTQFEEAKAMYRANKELFDRLWKEGKLPKNHVPMVVVRMDNAAINSNEAMFRFMAPKLKSFPKKVQKIAFDTFLNQLESKKKTKSVEPALIEAFIKKNKIKDLGTLFDLIVEDAKKRAKGNEDTFALTTKAYIIDMIASPVGVKKASKPVAKAIMNATDYNGEIFLIDHILSKIGETSMVEGERGDAVAIMGVDVSKNGGVTKAKHNNYGFGPKGRLIALIKNPTNVLQIFPEWRTKAFKMFEVKPSTGKMKTDAQVLADVYGQVFGDKAFRGSRLTKEMSDIDMVSAQMRFAFPSVSVSQSQEEFDEVLKQEGIRTAEANGNTILGLTKDGKIFLNPSRKSLSTPIHEFGHIWIDYLRSEESGSKGSKLLERGLELVEGTKALESAIKKYGDNALAREEALVELMGTKGETIANAAKRAKFVEWFNAFFKYIKEKLTRFADIKTKDIKDITLEEFVDIGLAELFSGEAVDAKFKPEEATESAKARMQIIGENAQLSQQVKENLSIARVMEENNKSPKEIRLATGWEKGTDGKWRYETLPNQLNKESKALEEISDSVFEILKAAVNNPNKFHETKKEYKLSDLIKNKELFNAYPKMSQEEAMEKLGRWDYTMDKSIEDLKVVVDISTYHYEGGLEGVFMKPAFFEDEDPSITIYVNPLYYYNKRSREYELLQIISHEVQHYVQMLKEDFSRGTSTESVFEEISSSIANVYQRQNEIKKDVIFSIKLGEFDIDVRRKLEPKIEDIFDSKISSKEMSKKINSLISKSKGDEKLLLETLKSRLDKIISIEQRIEQYEELGDYSKAFESYEKAAGEVEARNIEARLSMTPEQRRETLFEETEDIAREDQLLFISEFDAESFYPMASMKEKGQIKPSMSAQNIIKKARAAEEPIRDAVIIDYLMSEKKLTRKQAISALKRANRGDLKDAVKRLFNNVEDITDIKEKDAQLIKDILKFDRSITRADKIAQKKIKKEIISRLKAIQRKSKGKVSQSQLLAVVNRFSNVNLSSEKSIDSFVDYMQKVFSDIEYASKMTSLNKSIKQAKKNINSKIGRGADGLAYELKRLLNISPTIIPDSVFEEYSDLITSFGERKTVLKLKDSVEVKETIAKIFTELENQNSKLGELTERFEAFDDKKFTKTGAVSFSETVAQMVKDKAITEDEAKLMRKFKSDIMPIEKAEGKTEEDKQKEMEEEKKNLIENIKNSSVDVQRIELAIEKALVKDFARLIKTDAINELSNAQLKNIEKAIDNINNGYVTHYVLLASENLESINRSKMGAEGIRDAKPLAVSTQIAKIKTLYRSGSDANKFYKLIERNPLVNIDMVLGDFSSKRVFNSVLEESAEAVATFNTELNKVYKRIDEAEIMLQKKFKYNGNKILESKYKQMAYMVQQEFESNPNNPQVNPAAAVIKETIKKLRDSNQNYEAKILEKILKDYSTDGEIDLKKLDDSFVYAELNMIKVVQDINSKLTDKATYTASVIRGESIEPLNDYIHQSVLNTDGVAVDDSRALSESYMENIKPSTKAKNLIERTKGAKAINFDITASVRRGAKMTLMDYHLTSAFRTANRTLNKMEEQLEDEGQQRQIFLAVRDAYNQAISDVLENTFTSSSISEQIFQYAAKQGYRSMLASIPRVFGELLSNYAFAITNPVEFTEGSKPKNMRVAFSERGIEVMNNVRSKETARVYGEGLSGRFVETSMIEKKMGLAADAAKNPVVNRLNQGLSYLKKYPRGVEVIADFMITTPDKLVTRPMWFGTFSTEFKKITGQEVNFDKIAENDAEYMDKFEKAINEAKKKADANSVLIGATDNPLQGILKNKKRASDKASIIKTINSFMQRFLLFEYNAFRKGMYASIGRGDISKTKGALLMLAVSARMTMYTVMIPILNSLMFADDEEEEEESTYTKVYRALLSTATNIMIGRDFGAIVKMIQNILIEKANKDFGEDFGVREGEYNPYKNSVQYNIIPPEKPWKETSFIQDVVPNLIGPYSPLVKSITFGIDKFFFAKPKKEDDAKERQRREKYQRIPLEIGGLTGLVPFYRDLRKKLNEDIYKGLRDKDSKGESESKSTSSRSGRKGRKSGRKGRSDR